MMYVICKDWEDAKEHIKLVESKGLKIIKTEETKRGTVRVYY